MKQTKILIGIFIVILLASGIYFGSTKLYKGSFGKFSAPKTGPTKSELTTLTKPITVEPGFFQVKTFVVDGKLFLTLSRRNDIRAEYLRQCDSVMFAKDPVEIFGESVGDFINSKRTFPKPNGLSLMILSKGDLNKCRELYKKPVVRDLCNSADLGQGQPVSGVGGAGTGLSGKATGLSSKSSGLIGEAGKAGGGKGMGKVGGDIGGKQKMGGLGGGLPEPGNNLNLAEPCSNQNCSGQQGGGGGGKSGGIPGSQASGQAMDGGGEQDLINKNHELENRAIVQFSSSFQDKAPDGTIMNIDFNGSMNLDTGEAGGVMSAYNPQSGNFIDLNAGFPNGHPVESPGNAPPPRAASIKGNANDPAFGNQLAAVTAPQSAPAPAPSPAPTPAPSPSPSPPPSPAPSPAPSPSPSPSPPPSSGGSGTGIPACDLPGSNSCGGEWSMAFQITPDQAQQAQGASQGQVSTPTPEGSDTPLPEDASGAAGYDPLGRIINPAPDETGKSDFAPGATVCGKAPAGYSPSKQGFGGSSKIKGFATQCPEDNPDCDKPGGKKPDSPGGGGGGCRPGSPGCGD